VAYMDWNGEFGLPNLFAELPLENFAKVYAFLAAQTNLNLNDLTVIGFSKGAELVLLLATIYPEIKRVIAYVPSSLVWSGFTNQHFVSQSSWSYQDQPLPYALFANGHFDENGWQDQAMIEAATIPVEKITASILLISTSKDVVWPSTRMADNIMHRLEIGGATQPRQHLSFEEAGHSLSVPGLPTVVYGGVERAANAQAERHAWTQMLQFLSL
jgi:dienelactone hydrolase